MREADIGGSRICTQIVHVLCIGCRGRNQLTVGTKGRKRKIVTLYQSLDIALNDLKSSCSGESRAVSKKRVEVKGFLIIAF